jgi:hypothetical protein
MHDQTRQKAKENKRRSCTYGSWHHSATNWMSKPVAQRHNLQSQGEDRKNIKKFVKITVNTKTDQC